MNRLELHEILIAAFCLFLLAILLMSAGRCESSEKQQVAAQQQFSDHSKPLGGK